MTATPDSPPARPRPAGQIRRRRLVASLAGVVGSMSLLTGCLTGERPTLDTSATAEVTDDNVLTVTNLLASGSSASFTAGYDVTVLYGNTTVQAVVVQDGTRRSVTIGTVRYVTDAGATTTCTVGDPASCVDQLDATRVADLQVTPEFWSTSAVARIRRDADARIAETALETIDIAGQQATCVSIPVPNGTPEYCALAAGPLARQDSADVRIVLTSFSPTPDPDAFSPS